MRVPSHKLVPWHLAERTAASLRRDGLLLVTTNGCFDLLHLGHLNYLREARGLGDRLWIGLNSDASVRKLKGPERPLQDQNTRALQLAALECVDFVTIFDQDTPSMLLEKIAPAVHVKGGDYRPEDLPESAVVQAGGGKVVCVAFTAGFSTTELIRKIRESKISSL